MPVKATNWMNENSGWKRRRVINVATNFWQNRLYSLKHFLSGTILLFQHFNTVLVELSFCDHVCFKTKSLFCIFWVLQTGKVSGSPIWRIRWVLTQFKVYFLYICHRFNRSVHSLGEKAVFLFHMGRFLHFFLFQKYQLAHITVAIDSLAFFKVINEENSMRVPKFVRHNLTNWLLHFLLLWATLADCCPLSSLAIFI